MFRRTRDVPVGCRGLRFPGVGVCCALAAVVLAFGAGCSVHQPGHEEPIEPPGSFNGGGDTPVPDRWWRAFGDPKLNELQKRALAGNFDLMAARDRLQAAREVVARETATDYPAIDLSMNAQRAWRQSEDFDGASDLGADLVAEYEVDLWNRIESEIERTRFERAATRQDLDTAAITLTANVASTWYALVQQRGQRAVLKKQIETNQTVLKAVRLRFEKGQVRLSDVLRQERLLESTREQLERVNSEIETLKHQLLVLTGRSPTERLAKPGDELPALPPKPSTGLPSELLHRRPDVRSAFYAVKAADRSIAAAIADRYPRLTLSVSTAIASDDPADLFENWIQRIAADAITPVFDAGRRKAEVRRTEAVKKQRLDEYGQAILTALREVSDALSREVHQREQIRLIRSQRDLAEQTYERLYREYLNGDINYIDVLDALTRQQQLQRSLLETRFQLINNRVALYRALAGGWEGVVKEQEEEKAEEAGDAKREGEKASEESEREAQAQQRDEAAGGPGPRDRQAEGEGEEPR